MTCTYASDMWRVCGLWLRITTNTDMLLCLTPLLWPLHTISKEKDDGAFNASHTMDNEGVGDIGTVWLMPVPALPNQGRANISANVSPVRGRILNAATNFLAWLRWLGFNPNDTLCHESTPKFWHGNCRHDPNNPIHTIQQRPTRPVAGCASGHRKYWDASIASS